MEALSCIVLGLIAAFFIWWGNMISAAGLSEEDRAKQLRMSYAGLILVALAMGLMLLGAQIVGS